MTSYGWTNSDGEPLIDGAALRFEWALDQQSADERYLEDEYGYDYYPDEVDPADCTHGDYSWDTDWDGDESVTNVECDICETKAVSWNSDEGLPVNIIWSL